MPSFNNMPYGNAPYYCFPLTELSIYMLLLICGWHAVKKGIDHVFWLLGGLCFGLMLEYVNISSNSGYVYGHFWLMLGTPPYDIPFCIGCGWGVIIYASKLFTDNYSLPLWAAAALDSLLALHIDLSMDVVAYRLHMWHWDWIGRGYPSQVLTGQWFGVPYANFYGWLLVVFFYSFFGRLLKVIFLAKIWKTASPLFSILISQIVLYIALFPFSDLLKKLFHISSAQRLVALLIILILLVIIGFSKRKMKVSYDFPLAVWIVPAWFHTYFLGWLFLGGFAAENIWMTSFSIFNIALGFMIHVPYFFIKRWQSYNRSSLTNNFI